MPKIAFFCNLIGLYRYALPICENIESLAEKDCSYSFIYDQEMSNMKEKILNSSFSGNLNLIHSPRVTLPEISKVLSETNPDILLVFAQRLPDSAYVSVAKNLGIKTVMFQHGMYIPFMKREASFFGNNLLKTYKYMQCATTIAKASQANSYAYICEYLKIFVLGHKFISTSIKKQHVNVDQVLVYGEFWKQYHQEEFGYELDSQKTVGYQDLEKIKHIIANPKEKCSVCYIAQTLVEDGRMARETFIEFIEILSRSIPDTEKFYIKLHPRSDISLFDILVKQNSAVLCTTEAIPHCERYIGHYSTVIALVSRVSRNVLLWEFDDHPIPRYFSDYCQIVTKKAADLKLFFKVGSISEQTQENLSKMQDFFYHDDEETSYSKIARYLLSN